MKKTYTFMRIIAVALIALAIGAAQARAAVTVYADEVPSNGVVAASAPVVETNVPAAQTNLNAKSRSGGGNSDVRIDETGVHIGGPNPVDVELPSYLRHREGMRNVMGIVSILSPFVMVVAIVALAGYFGHRRTKLAHETIRAMIEKGMPVTPELVAELRSRRPPGIAQNLTRKSGLFPGLVLAGIGAALLIAGHGGDKKGGWIVLFIGVAFLVTWLVEWQHQKNTQPPKQ
ncbi:MAG: DUF6249 domain-containing protein [Verrucomicrobiia bacterium]|jgi:hypothetical protein